MWSASSGAPAARANLHQPSAVAIAADGGVWIFDAGRFRIRRVDPQTGLIATMVQSDCSASSPAACRRPTGSRPSAPTRA